MSRSKDSTSKKRKLTDLDRNEAALPPRKALVLANDSSDGIGNGIPEAAHAPVLITKESEPKTGPAAMTDERDRAQSAYKADPGTLKDVQNLDHESHAAEDTGGEDRIRETLNSNPKEEAALRQAKSERRSKKKRKPEVVDTPAATKPSTTLQTAVHGPNDQGQQAHKPSVSKPTPSTLPLRIEPKQRFIVFVGNLPYTATTTSIRTHFSKLEPFTLRHSTDKSTGRSRGFAFLEFEGYDKMKTCLKLYHHSLFDAAGGGGGDGGSFGSRKREKSRARRINIELTAGGGGGKSIARKERIKGKNEKLEGERERARLHREKEEAAANRKRKVAGEKTGGNGVEVTGGNGDVEDDNMHPSRRKRMKT